MAAKGREKTREKVAARAEKAHPCLGNFGAWKAGPKPARPSALDSIPLQAAQIPLNTAAASEENTFAQRKDAVDRIPPLIAPSD